MKYEIYMNCILLFISCLDIDLLVLVKKNQIPSLLRMYLKYLKIILIWRTVSARPIHIYAVQQSSSRGLTELKLYQEHDCMEINIQLLLLWLKHAWKLLRMLSVYVMHVSVSLTTDYSSQVCVLYTHSCSMGVCHVLCDILFLRLLLLNFGAF